LNLAYFGVEVAVQIGSVSLFADSIDFLEDASVNFLILVAPAGASAPAPASEWAWRCFSWYRPPPGCGRYGKNS
jgi:Co/Zn/Cd efflux system component